MLDMKAGGFWTPGVTAFFDVPVTHVNFRSNQGKHTATIFKEQENEKKRKYNQRVMDVEMGSFIPLVFGTNGGMGLDCQNFLRTLANMPTSYGLISLFSYVSAKLRNALPDFIRTYEFTREFTDGKFYTTGVWYKRGHGTRLSELFKNSRKYANQLWSHFSFFLRIS